MSFSVDDIKRADAKAQRCLTLQILMDNSLKEAFKATLPKVWNHEGSICFKKVGHHKFLVEFQRDVDIERELNGRTPSINT